MIILRLPPPTRKKIAPFWNCSFNLNEWIYNSTKKQSSIAMKILDDENFEILPPQKKKGTPSDILVSSQFHNLAITARNIVSNFRKIKR